MADSASPPVITADTASVLHWTDAKKVGNKWVFTLDATGAGRVTLSAVDSKGRKAPDLTVFAGVFKNHKDLKGAAPRRIWIADVYRGHDLLTVYVRSTRIFATMSTISPTRI